MKKNLLNGFQVPLMDFRFCGVDYHRRFRKCSKPNCRCQSGEGHGPYWYSSFQGQIKYVGKVLPPDLLFSMERVSKSRTKLHYKMDEVNSQILKLQDELALQKKILRSLDGLDDGDYFDLEVLHFLLPWKIL